MSLDLLSCRWAHGHLGLRACPLPCPVAAVSLENPKTFEVVPVAVAGAGYGEAFVVRNRQRCGNEDLHNLGVRPFG